MPGYVSGFGDDAGTADTDSGAEAAASSEVDPAKAAEAAARYAERKRRRQEANARHRARLAELPLEQWPVGRAPFDRK